MIIFDLACSDEHRFEGWFRSALDFTEQQARGLVACPHCGSVAVRRLPSILHVGSAASARTTTAVAESGPPPGEAATRAPVLGAAQLSALRTVVEEIVSRTEDVGNQFADEARKIHYHEAPARPIRGLASEDDCSALEDEGIDILRLRSVKPENLN
jgi:hypothetical protein